jgi:hypothetical protein
MCLAPGDSAQGDKMVRSGPFFALQVIAERLRRQTALLPKTQ